MWKKPSRDPCKLRYSINVIHGKGGRRKLVEMTFQGRNGSEPLNQEPLHSSPAKRRNWIRPSLRPFPLNNYMYKALTVYQVLF